MDYRDISTLLLRIAGVVIVIFAVIQIPGHFLNYYRLQEDSLLLFLGTAALPVALTILLGVLLWLFPNTVTNKIVGGSDQPSGFDLEKIQVIAFSVLGLYVLVRAVGDLVYWGSFMTMSSTIEPGGTLLSLDRYADLFATLAEFVLGLFLTFGSKGLSSLVAKVRA